MKQIYLLSERRKQRSRLLWVLFFLIALTAAIYFLGLEFANTEYEKESWIKTVAGIAVGSFSLYGLKILLMIK